MATAAEVTEVERDKLEWLVIKDDQGNSWKYMKTNVAADIDCQVHVDHHPLGDGGFRAAIARDRDGKAFLQQDGPGLPDTIIVDYTEGPTVRGYVAAMAWWHCPLEYKK